jgi:hypothetical protein
VAATLTQARVWLVFLVAVLALALPAAAGAGSQNYYTGWLTPSTPFDGGLGYCIWGPLNGEACSQWNYWNTNEWNVSNCGASSFMYAGFQNNARWRHREFYVGDGGGICLNAYINPSDLQMGGQYLEAHVLYSSGASTYGYGWAFA